MRGVHIISLSWLICESYDDKGNVMVYRYEKEGSSKVDLSQAQEKNRTENTRKVNRYPKFIRYGNHAPYYPKLIEDNLWTTPPGDNKWYFEVVFDNGKHNSEVPKSNDASQWEPRPNPFSSYRDGFEVRTYRLCQRVLMFHHFPDESNGLENYLVRSTAFDYAYELDYPNTSNPVHTMLQLVTQAGYKRDGNGFLKKLLPPLEFKYSKAVIHDHVHTVDAKIAENLPYSSDNLNYQWVDLNGEGLSGILSEQSGGWFYKANYSPITAYDAIGKKHIEAQFCPLQNVDEKPSLAVISSGRQQLLDLAGDGQLDQVALDETTPGFYERTHDGRWESFRTFISHPNLDDFTGDGHADILISDDDVFCWFTSLAEESFGPGERVRLALDEEKGPCLAFADGTQSIYLADFSATVSPLLSEYATA